MVVGPNRVYLSAVRVVCFTCFSLDLRTALISRKEEAELSKEFGKEYVAYKRKVSMFISEFRK